MVPGRSYGLPLKTFPSVWCAVARFTSLIDSQGQERKNEITPSVRLRPFGSCVAGDLTTLGFQRLALFGLCQRIGSDEADKVLNKVFRNTFFVSAKFIVYSRE